MRHLVGDRAVAGVADAGPDGEGRLGDGSGYKLGVESGEIPLRTAASHEHDQVRVPELQPGQGGGDLCGCLRPLHARGLEAHLETVAGAFELTGEVAVGLRARARDEPDPKRHRCQSEPPVRVQQPLGAECAEKTSPGSGDAADQGLDVEGRHRKAELAAAFPDRDLAADTNDQSRCELDADRVELVLDHGPFPGPAGDLQGGSAVSNRAVAKEFVPGEYERAVSAP